MFVGLTNTPRDYAWGSTSAIADLLGRPRSGEHEAEYWLGTHPGSPALLLHPAVDGATRLSDLTTLPFLLKILAAESALSLQAHPTLEQAREGFRRENALGIPLDAPNRNYRDQLHKPELLFALSDEFAALCGFRPVAATRELLAPLNGDPVIDEFLAKLVDDDSLRPIFEWLISNGPGVDELVSRIVASASTQDAAEFEMVTQLAAAWPADPGVVIALLLNRVVLAPGQALYLPAGNIHAYLRGVGIELMSSSDNVLRGGLTPKHVDVAELLAVLDFRPVPVPVMTPETPEPGVTVFRPDVPDFELVVFELDGERVSFSPRGESLLLCTDGEFTVDGLVSHAELHRGESSYVSADEAPLGVTGRGRLFLATMNTASR
jgi:mannose-6-phosphate isomerase